MSVAITRDISPSIDRCELTHVARLPIDLHLAREQHDNYERCLSVLGCTVHRLPAAADLPDCVFVEDCAIVLDEAAIITRPGAPSRRAELPSVAAALAPLRPLMHLQPPATLDGGDVLRARRTLFVGISSRTNAAGVEQLRQLTAPLGYAVVAVEVRGCLHLKSAVTEVEPGVLLVNPSWVPATPFDGFERVEIDPVEPFGANALRIGDALVCAAAFPRTAARLASRGLRVHTVDLSELAKAEGAVTCCSLILS